MARIFVLALLLILCFISCKTGPSLFSKRSPHEQYAKKLTDAGLDATALGQAWFRSAERALQQPVTINLPFTQSGYFAQDRPEAAGLRFTAQRGQQLRFTIEKTPATGFALYTDLWKQEGTDAPDHIRSPDSAESSFAIDVDEEATYILRLQPELLKSGSYTLRISVGPSLGFPVAGNRGRVQSYWGDARDAGARSHEGIDIFAPRGTPVVAAADGIVGRVNENNLGGKVVWMRPKGRNLNLYYAHLDSQIARAGQRVKQGDTLGLIGNTGNARSTPPHLHFGIYGFGGAIDPLPFVDRNIKEAVRFTADRDRLNRLYRLRRSITSEGQTLERNTAIYVVAEGPEHLLARLPEGKAVLLPDESAQEIDNQIDRVNLRDSALLRDAPLPDAAVKRRLPAREPVTIHAYYKDFAFIRSGDQEGWVPATAIR